VSELPRGIVTFLFSDVEGSTRRARELGDELWAELLGAHRKILRAAFAAHAGREVDTQGDSFFVAFARATDAAACAIAVQRSLSAHDRPEGADLRVRIGLHTGEALVRDRQYVGQEVHRASRICNAGHGGQIVLSHTTAELLRGALPQGVALIDLGRHRLKDLGAAQPLFQILAEGLRRDFPPLRTLESFPNNLPAQRSSFVGREKEVEQVRSLLGGRRLVTLTGVGGVGKTRLALQAGAEELGRFPDGVFFADLAPIADPAVVAQAIASASGLSFGGAFAAGARPIEDVLLDYLAKSRCLLLVDNCEHLLDRVAEFLDRLLAGCPDVVICATSREPLGLEGEHVFRVPSLSLPEEGTNAEHAEAVRLFVERAGAVKQGFAASAQDLEAIAEICRRLDGIPLAIEFAAARVPHLSPHEIAERLGDAFRLLTGGRRRVGRQQTLEAALDWSHELLSPVECAVFRRIGVFPGSFGLHAAEEVASDAEIPSGSILDQVGSLVAKSLLTTEEGSEGVRYRLLETVRAYALRKLWETGEAAALRSRHREHYLGRLEGIPLERAFWSPRTIGVLTLELDNLRAAADWSVEDDRPDLLGRLAARAVYVSLDADQLPQVHAWLLRAIEAPERLSREEWVACHAILSFTSMQMAEGRSVEFATLAIDLAVESPSPFLVFALANRALALVATALFARDEETVHAGRRDARRAVEIAQSGLSRCWLAYAYLSLGQTEWLAADSAEAAPHLAAAREAIRGTRDFQRLESFILSNLAICLHLLGRTEEALEAALACRELQPARAGERSLRNLYFVADTAPVLAAGGAREAAAEPLRRVLERAQRVKHPLYANLLFCAAGAVAHVLGDPERAARLLAAARYVGGAAEFPIPFRTPASYAIYRHYVPLVRETLGPERARRARDKGRAMTTDEAIEYALEGLVLSERGGDTSALPQRRTAAGRPVAIGAGSPANEGARISKRDRGSS
jgi:predicted ATPase/class 3 adenylate cyclase